MSHSGEDLRDEGRGEARAARTCCPSVARWTALCCDVWREDQKGWIVCICVATIGIIGIGIAFSFGVFIVALKDQYHTSLMEQNFIASTPLFIAMFLAPFVVTLIRRMGRHAYRLGSMIGIAVKATSCLASSFVQDPSWLFLTYSFVFGFGNCMVFMVSALVVAEYFETDHQYHVLATSVVRYPVPLGFLIFSPISATLIAQYGWRVTLRIYSVPLLVGGVLLSWPFTPKPREPESLPLTATEQVPGDDLVEDQQEQEGFWQHWNFREMYQRPEIGLWYFGNFLTALGYTLPLFNLPYYMSLRAIPPTDSAWILTMMGITEFCTYVVGSLVGDHLKGRLVYVNAVAAALMTVCYLLLPLGDVNYGSISVFMILVSLCNGMLNVYQYPAAIEVTGLRMDKAWACTNFWASPGMLIGPPFFGFMYDSTGNFDYVFYAAGSFYVVQFVCFTAIVFIRRRRCSHTLSVSLGYQRVS